MMKILLDTHIALWALYESSKLTDQVKEILQNPDNEIFYSVISAWEIEIKRNLHPESIRVTDVEFAEKCEASDFLPLPLYNRHVYTLKTLTRPEAAPAHKDPFDRIIV